MGTEIYCDYCGTSVPIADSAYPIIVGKNEIAKVCIHCSQKIESIIKAQKSKIMQERKDLIHLGNEYRDQLDKEEQIKINEQKAAQDLVNKPVEFQEDDKNGSTKEAHSGDLSDCQEDKRTDTISEETKDKVA